jgi:hypothetical protein
MGELTKTDSGMYSSQTTLAGFQVPETHSLFVKCSHDRPFGERFRSVLDRGRSRLTAVRYRRTNLHQKHDYVKNASQETYASSGQ